MVQNFFLQKKKIFPFFLCAWILSVFFFAGIACAEKASLRVEDSAGNVLDFFTIPERVVSLVPSATEMLFEIGAGDFVEAVTYHDNTLKGAADKKIIGGFFLPSLGAIESSKPDMIILSSIHEDVIKQYEKTGCKIFVFKTGTIENSYDSIKAFGKIFHREKKALQVIHGIQSKLALIKQKINKIENLEKKRVIRLMGKDTIMTPGKDSFQSEVIKAAGGIPPDFGKGGNIINVTKEEWIKFNPQVIYGCEPDKEAAQNFFSKPGWKDVDAVKNHQIYYFPCDLTCRISTHTGDFVSWLSSVIYTKEFAESGNDILPLRVTGSKPVTIDLDYIKAASVIYSSIHDFENKTLLLDFKSPLKIISTLEGERNNITSVGNHFFPPPDWAPGHERGIENIRLSVLKTIKRNKQNTSFLLTGADMDNLSVQTINYKDMKVYALVTAGVMSNAMRMSKDVGNFYEHGTINIIILTNMALSQRAMTRAVISATEAKTAALEDMDIRSSYTPRFNGATGTGTDNILVVQGAGPVIKNTGGHSKMGELISKAVYSGVREAVLQQNGINEKRTVFQRFKERKIRIYELVSGADCGCQDKRTNFAALVEQLLLDTEYTSFIEASFAISDDYEKGLIKDLRPFHRWCKQIAEKIAGRRIEYVKEMVQDDSIPVVIQSALDAVLSGAQARLNPVKAAENNQAFKRVISLSPIITETIYLLNAQDSLIGNTTYCNVPKEAQFKEKIGSVIQINVEKIIRLHPDLVIASPLSREKQLKILRNQNINVITIKNPETFPQMCDITMRIGKVLGKEDVAQKIIKKAEKEVEAIRLKTADHPGKKVFIQIGMKPLHSANKETFINEYIHYGGGINIAENEKSGIYSREKVIKENPDVILIATMGTSRKSGEIEKQRWMNFSSLNAAMQNQIYVLDPEIICSPTPATFVKGLKKIVSLIHPGLI